LRNENTNDNEQKRERAEVLRNPQVRQGKRKETGEMALQTPQKEEGRLASEMPKAPTKGWSVGLVGRHAGEHRQR